MEMSPQRVRDVEFKSVRKGVDPDEVRHFLDDVADELERAQNQSAAMEARARAAVARLQEMSEQSGTSPADTSPSDSAASDTASAPRIEASVDEAETISRTLLLAQRTADTAVAEARAEAARIVRGANDEAATTLDSTREMAAQLVVEARDEARAAGESERISVAGEVESLKARRDFLESDVEQLEIFLADQRNRIRESATSLLDITERIPGGLGQTRPPLLSASDDDDVQEVDEGEEVDGDDRDPADDDLLIVTDLADEVDEPEAPDDLAWSDEADDPTVAMPKVDTSEISDDAVATDREFRFSFDDDRR